MSDTLTCPQDAIAGALFDFLGALTMGEPIELGSTIEPHGALKRLEVWAEKRGLELETADVTGWPQRLIRS